MFLQGSVCFRYIESSNFTIFQENYMNNLHQKKREEGTGKKSVKLQVEPLDA